MLIGEEPQSIKDMKDTAKKEADEAEKVILNNLVKAEKKNKIEVRYNSVLESIKKQLIQVYLL